jgi:putative redox protein
MSTIKLTHTGQGLNFECKNERGGIINLSGLEEMGGAPKNFRPMEGLLASLVGCSSIDILSILEKQRYVPKHYEVEVEGNRKDGAIPAVFTSITVNISISKDVDENKLKKAIQLTQEKYCSVLFMIQHDCNILFNYVLR